MPLIVGIVVAFLVVFAVAGGFNHTTRDPDAGPQVTGLPTTSPTTLPGNATPPAGGETALAALESLPVKGKSPLTGYDRTGDFGHAWIDVDLNGCDTRNDVLARDLGSVLRPSGCRVLSGVLNDPYTGRVIDFVRGQKTSTLVQIDHLVPLANAWQTGAQKLTPQQRIDLANDPLELLAVDGSSNESKGDGDAATWLPPHKAFRCEYVARQIAVKAKYQLWVTSAEKAAIIRVLTGCPDRPAATA
ncbi:MAG TPA: HNH endonuclease family protein [Galbitalea sp.]